MKPIRRMESKHNSTGTDGFHVGDSVAFNSKFDHLKDIMYDVNTRHGNKRMRLSSVQNRFFFNTQAWLSLEVIDVRIDGQPSVYIDAEKTYLVRVAVHTKNQQEAPLKIIVPANCLVKIPDIVNIASDISTVISTVRKIHLLVLEHPDMSQPMCPWWLDADNEPLTKIAGAQCQYNCPLKIISKDDFIICGGTTRTLDKPLPSDDEEDEDDY